jgi:hypothetical protein
VGHSHSAGTSARHPIAPITASSSTATVAVSLVGQDGSRGSARRARHGHRVVNEKAPYNERGRIHSVFDATTKSYENNILFQVYDDALAHNDEMGVKYPVPYPGQPWDLVVSGNTWDELADAIDERLAKLAADTGGFAWSRISRAT